MTCALAVTPTATDQIRGAEAEQGQCPRLRYCRGSGINDDVVERPIVAVILNDRRPLQSYARQILPARIKNRGERFETVSPRGLVTDGIQGQRAGA